MELYILIILQFKYPEGRGLLHMS